MSCVLILTPVIAAGWPILSQLVMSVLTNMGFSTIKEGEEVKDKTGKGIEKTEEGIELEVKNTQTVTDTLKREGKLVLKKEDIVVTFVKDIRGKCKVTVRGKNRSQEELKKVGEEITQKIVQQYVYNNIKGELKKKNFTVVNEEVSSDKSIRITVRKWN